MARTFLQFMHDETGNTRSLLNESVWATLDGSFQKGKLGMTPLDEILVGASRVRFERKAHSKLKLWS
jgi:hypothetical protein